MKMFFILGTDTGVGKSFISGLLAAVMRKYVGKEAVLYIKPFQTGVAENSAASDAAKVAAQVARLEGTSSVSPMTADLAKMGFITLRQYPLAVAPYWAARAAQAPLQSQELQTLATKIVTLMMEKSERRVLVVEGSGGMLTPLAVGTGTKQQRIILFADFFKMVYELQMIECLGQLGSELSEVVMKVILVGRSALGTLNHTLLSSEALARRGLPLSAVFLNDHFMHHSGEEAGGQPDDEQLASENVHFLKLALKCPVFRFGASLGETSESWLTRDEPA